MASPVIPGFYSGGPRSGNTSLSQTAFSEQLLQAVCPPAQCAPGPLPIPTALMAGQPASRMCVSTLAQPNGGSYRRG